MISYDAALAELLQQIRFIFHPGRREDIYIERTRLSAALMLVSEFFQAHELDRAAASFQRLGGAMSDLANGNEVDPLVKATVYGNRQPDQSRIWHVRVNAAIGIELLILSGETRKAAADLAMKTAPSLKLVARQDKRGKKLATALLSWVDQLKAGKVKNRYMQKAYDEQRPLFARASAIPAGQLRAAAMAAIELAERQANELAVSN
jgi:hypothetical protein